MEDSAILEIFDKGQYDDVLEHLKNREETTLSEALLIAKGISTLRTGDPSSAIRIFNIILASNPTHPEVSVYKTAAENTQLKLTLDLANECIRAGDYSNAYEHYTTICSNHEGLNANVKHQINTNRAVCLLNLNRAAEALEVIDEAIGQDTNSEAHLSELFFSKAVILKQLNRSSDAYDIYTQHLTTSTDVKVQLGYAETALATSNHDIAIAEATKILSKAETTPDMQHSAYLCRGVAYLHMHRCQEALDDLTAAKALSGPSISEDSIAESNRLLQLCHTLLGDEAFEHMDYASASDNYQQALDMAAASGTASAKSTLLFNLALCSHRSGNLAAAVEGYQRVLEHDSNHFAANAALGVVLLQQEESVASSPSSNEPSLSLLSATAALETAHKINASDIEVLYNLGVCYLRSGKHSNSSGCFAKVLKLNPEHEGAKKGLGIAENLIASNAAAAKKSLVPPSTATSVSQPVAATKEAAPQPAPAASVATSEPPKPAAPEPSPSPASVSPAAAPATTSATPVYPMSQLLAPGPYPSDVNPSTREIYLSSDEFQSAFGCTRDQFYAYPNWKQIAKKKQLGLF